MSCDNRKLFGDDIGLGVYGISPTLNLSMVI